MGTPVMEGHLKWALAVVNENLQRQVQEPKGGERHLGRQNSGDPKSYSLTQKHPCVCSTLGLVLSTRISDMNLAQLLHVY